ncbi:FBP domain-containing protein [Leucobacter sp. 1207-22]|uniref:FBP domain-containing protein n=1 Tax=Leucobacter sp. 1207-22 TaxID=2604456 RepID=UPI0040629239
MLPYPLSTFRAALGNVDDATRRTVRLPRHPLKPSSQLRDYYGWRDPSAPQRGYLFTEQTGALTGIMLTTTRTHTAAGRAVMCEFCRIPRRFEQVALFTASTATHQRSQSGLGTYLCVDLDCNARVNALQPLTPLDPPAEALVTEHRAALARRSAAFITSVLRQARRTA